MSFSRNRGSKGLRKRAFTGSAWLAAYRAAATLHRVYAFWHWRRWVRRQPFPVFRAGRHDWLGVILPPSTDIGDRFTAATRVVLATPLFVGPSLSSVSRIAVDLTGRGFLGHHVPAFKVVGCTRLLGWVIRPSFSVRRDGCSETEASSDIYTGAQR